MASSTRRRLNSALLAAAWTSSSDPASDAVPPGPRFHLDLWVCFTLHNWILDVGRSVATLVLPTDWSPLNRPGVAEYLHLLHGAGLPLLLLRMLERSPRTLPRAAVRLCVIAVVMGTSLQLVAEAVTRRLLLIGYQLHLSIRENPVLKKLEPASLVDVLELLFYLDDTLGRLLRGLPLFLVLFLFFSGCFHHRKQEEKMAPAAWALLAPSAAHYWFLVTEDQIFILFIFTFFVMNATVMHQRRRGLLPDGNALFLLHSFSVALVLVLVWVVCLWDDAVLRKKSPGLIFIPQPRVVFTLHLRPDFWT